MKTWKEVTLRDKSGEEITKSYSIPIELVERIAKGELTIVKIIEYKQAEMLSLFEIDLCRAHDNGRSFPIELQSHVERALKKRRELRAEAKNKQKPVQVLFDATQG